MDKHAIAQAPRPEDLAAVTGTFKALADPTRARIALLLTAGGSDVGELVTRLNAPQSSVSRHLAVMRSTGLVVAERRGTHVFYRLASSHVGDLVVQAFSHAEHERLGLPDHAATGGERAADPPVAESRH